MAMLFEYTKNYAENFRGKGSQNLILMGGTGLGKTHLSSAVAKRIIERGYDVYYVSAINMFSGFEFAQFGRTSSFVQESPERCLECDLLIVDDLGTELTNQFTVSTLYNLINTRMNLGKTTIISTNLTQSEIRQRYSDRIASRIFGDFYPLFFKGCDVRLQKARNS